jgi:hypothetical protein
MALVFRLPNASVLNLQVDILSPTHDDANFLAEDSERPNPFDGPLDDGDSSDSDGPNSNSEGSNSKDELSLTEPDSDDVEGHQLWEKREKARKKKVKRRQQRKRENEEQLWGQEIRQEKERQEEEDRRQQARSRQLEEERHNLRVILYDTLLLYIVIYLCQILDSLPNII